MVAVACVIASEYGLDFLTGYLLGRRTIICLPAGMRAKSRFTLAYPNHLPSPIAGDSGESSMRFRLTYEGELKASQKDPIGNQHDRLAEHKQGIRQVFHRQLMHLWQTNKFLRERRELKDRKGILSDHRPVGDGSAYWGDGGDTEPLSEHVANLYPINGYRFVPLVREEISLLCNLHILFLRRDIPGGVIHAGDLDNRIKTVIDALRYPTNPNELRGNETPGPDEDPFYCLLDDDKAVTGLVVETDMLLDPPTGNTDADQRQVRLVITVEVKPYNVTMFNLSFA